MSQENAPASETDIGARRRSGSAAPGGSASRLTRFIYESDRLVKADGLDLNQAGPLGLTGTLYVVEGFVFVAT